MMFTALTGIFNVSEQMMSILKDTLDVVDTGVTDAKITTEKRNASSLDNEPDVAKVANMSLRNTQSVSSKPTTAVRPGEK